MPIARRTGEDDLMTEMPHAIAGDKIPEELYRITEAYLREHDMPVAGARLNADLCNAAIDWWNAPSDEFLADLANPIRLEPRAKVFRDGGQA